MIVDAFEGQTATADSVERRILGSGERDCGDGKGKASGQGLNAGGSYREDDGRSCRGGIMSLDSEKDLQSSSHFGIHTCMRRT